MDARAPLRRCIDIVGPSVKENDADGIYRAEQAILIFLSTCVSEPEFLNGIEALKVEISNTTDAAHRDSTVKDKLHGFLAAQRRTVHEQ